jgi:hypothetical protein
MQAAGDLISVFKRYLVHILCTGRPYVQLDRGHTNEEVEATLATFYHGSALLSQTHTPITAGSGLMNNKGQQILALVYFDCAVCLFVFCAALGFAVVQNHMGSETEVNMVTITDYSVQVTGLPATTNADKVSFLEAHMLFSTHCMLRDLPLFESCCRGFCNPMCFVSAQKVR